jgi:hypothetical protein
MAQDKATSPKGGDKTSENGWTEEGDAGHTTVIVTGFGVAAGANVPAIMTAKEMSCKSANDGEEQAEREASGINNHRALFQFMVLMIKGRRNPSSKKACRRNGANPKAEGRNPKSEAPRWRLCCAFEPMS